MDFMNMKKKMNLSTNQARFVLNLYRSVYSDTSRGGWRGTDGEDEMMYGDEDYNNGEEEMAEDWMAGVVVKTEIDEDDVEGTSLTWMEGEETDYEDRMAGIIKTEVDDNDSWVKEEAGTIFREEEESEEEGHHLDFEDDSNDSDYNPLGDDNGDYSDAIDDDHPDFEAEDNRHNQSDAIPSDSQHRDADQPDDELSQDLQADHTAHSKKASKSYKKKTKRKKKTKEPKDRPNRWQLFPSKYRCKLCEVLCKELTDMKEHIVQMHSNQQVTKPKRKKNDGDKDTSHVNILEEGLSDFEVSELSIAMRLCPICDQYVKENRIPSHLDTHRLKNTICEVCGTACTNMGALSLHKSRCKRANNCYKCEDCDKEYSFMASLLAHRYRQHKNKPKVTKQCEICGKEFTSAKSYRKHLPVHMTVKPYECPDCGKGFTQRSNMTYHRRVHTGDKPYKCDMCTEMFAHNVSLKTHKKKKHNIDMWKD